VTLQTQSCGILTTQASSTSQATKPVRAVPCLSLGQIKYHAPKTLTEVEDWSAGKLPDTTNHFDTPDTVQTIRSQNASIAAICGTN
jgi:hypothetical protein